MHERFTHWYIWRHFRSREGQGKTGKATTDRVQRLPAVPSNWIVVEELGYGTHTQHMAQKIRGPETASLL